MPDQTEPAKAKWQSEGEGGEKKTSVHRQHGVYYYTSFRNTLPLRERIAICRPTPSHG